jgi:hypothetical protein
MEFKPVSGVSSSAYVSAVNIFDRWGVIILLPVPSDMISSSCYKINLIRKVVIDEIINEQNQDNIKTAGHIMGFNQLLVWSLLTINHDRDRTGKYDTGIR